jgi:transposase-like protein
MPIMGIYSKELRIRAVDAVERGIPRKDVVETFSISLTTLKRWLRKRKDGEDLSPGTSTGRKRRILATLEEKQALWQQLAKRTTSHLRAPLPAVGSQAGGQGFALRDESGHTPQARVDLQKKTLAATERDEEKRSAFRERLRGVDPKRLIFVDESSTNVALTPRYARAPRGERAHGTVPKNWGKNVTLISSISLEGMGPRP